MRKWEYATLQQSCATSLAFWKYIGPSWRRLGMSLSVLERLDRHPKITTSRRPKYRAMEAPLCRSSGGPGWTCPNVGRRSHSPSVIFFKGARAYGDITVKIGSANKENRILGTPYARDAPMINSLHNKQRSKI